MVGEAFSESGWFLSRGGKTYGPLSENDLRLHMEKGRLKPTDLIWRPGFEDWRPVASILGQTRPPPIPSHRFFGHVRSRPRKWKLALCAVGVTALVVGLYTAWPYHTLWRLKHAIETKDSLALENMVDWPRIRNQIKSEILAASYASTPADSDGLGVLGTALGAAIVGPMIESKVQPAEIIRAASSPGWTETLKRIDVRSGYFVGPMTFRLDMERQPIKSEGGPTGVGFILELQGTGWRVTHIDLPWEEFRATMREPASLEKTSPLTTNKADRLSPCKIENWKFRGLGKRHTVIEGTTTCASGTVRIQAYDDKGNYLGNAKGYIKANSFETMVSSPAPAKLEIKYQIARD